MYSTVSIYHNKTQTSLNNLTWYLVWIVNVNDQAFTDVTLATLDNQHVRAHKIILSSGSTFFKNILVRNLHQNPLIYLKDITSNHSKNILVRNLHQNPLIYLKDITSNHSKCLTSFRIPPHFSNSKKINVCDTICWWKYCSKIYIQCVCHLPSASTLMFWWEKLFVTCCDNVCCPSLMHSGIYWVYIRHGQQTLSQHVTSKFFSTRKLVWHLMEDDTQTICTFYGNMFTKKWYHTL